MKIIMTGSERAHLLASLIPQECWESEGITVTQGPRRKGLETFVFDLPGMCRDNALEFIKRVLESCPPSAENSWFPSKSEQPATDRLSSLPDEEKNRYLKAAEREDDLWQKVLATKN